MKRILILIMSCNQDFFNREEQVCKETYLSSLPKNINYIIYKGGYEKTEYDSENHILQLNCPDGLKDTYAKTYDALKFINDNSFEYDYIFRTNTSTYINIDLLYYFVKRLDNKSMDIWGGELCYLFNPGEDSTFNNEKCYVRGNGMLINKKHVNIILNHGNLFRELKNTLVDDSAIGVVFANYFKQKYGKYIDKLKSFKEGWYKSILNEYSDHHVCKMNNTNKDFDFIKHMMIIQIKNWYDREMELQHFYEIHEVFKNNTDDDIEETYNKTIEYSNQPDVFLGEKYGFYDFNSIKHQINIE